MGALADKETIIVQIANLLSQHGVVAALLAGVIPVSYTHLDVYKRQAMALGSFSGLDRLMVISISP